MRADRLLNIMLLLRSHGKMTSQALADELEVSQRTILRDIDALSMAGVPIYADGGHHGGIMLDANYRVTLTGLKDDEVRALFISSSTQLLSELGLGEAADSTLLKLFAALPTLHQSSVEHIRQRVYIDPIWWWDDLLRLLDHLKIDKAHLIGCSMGGGIVIDYAIEHPTRVLSLVPISAVPGGFEMRGEMPQELKEMMAAAQKGDLERVSELNIRLWVDGPFRQPEQVNPQIRQHAAAMNKIPVARGTFMTDMNPLNPLTPPAAQRLDELHMPTLIIAGALDNSEVVRAADVMANEIKGAQKLIIQEAAHVPNMDKPAEFNRAVLAFLGNVK